MSEYYEQQEGAVAPEAMHAAPPVARVQLTDNDARAAEAMAKLVELGHGDLAADMMVALFGGRRCQTPAVEEFYRVSHHSTPKLDAAKARCQGLIRAAKINRRNSHLGNSYADINAVLEACMDACDKAGLAVWQTPWDNSSGHTILTTRIACDGEWIEGDMLVRVDAQKGVNNKQAGGIALTYIRRYALNAMLGIPAGDDTDGEDGDGEPHAPDKWGMAVSAFGDLGVKPKALLSFIGRKSPSDITDEDHTKFQQLYKALKAGDEKAKATIAKHQGD